MKGDINVEYITLFISLLSITFVIAKFVIDRQDKAKNDVKENSKEVIDIEVFKVEMKNIKEDMNEIKTDIKDIKRMYISYKDDMKNIADEVFKNLIHEEMQNHIEKYHTRKD
jgi:hypothetical protein